MREKEIAVQISIYDNIDEMQAEDATLIKEAVTALSKSYSPYSGFKVGAAALLANGVTISAANQENASYPVCVCAEVAMLSACSSMQPGVAIRKVAITTRSAKEGSHSPKAPCGQCRQTLLEFENRQANSMEIILHGTNGHVYTVKSVKDLLPLYFSETDL